MLRRLTKGHPYFRAANYIDGQFVPAVSGQTIPVRFPAAATADAEPLGLIPQSHHQDTHNAIDSAQSAFRSWAERDAFSRARILRKAGDLLRQRADDIAEVIAAESGKVLPEAKGEVLYSASYFDWNAGEAERVNGLILPPFRSGVRPMVIKKPVGVVACISPWNFPLAMIARSSSAALAAGCTVVWKPSDLTPYSGVALAMVLEEAGVPGGVFNVVQSGDAPSFGDTINNDKRVRKINFTGSVAVGKHLAAQAAKTMKRVSMELGGNAPFIVFEDADLDTAVKMFCMAKIRNAGQTCICPNRVLVHESVRGKFVDAIVDVYSKLKPGNSLADDTATIGPLITRKQRDRIHALVKNLQSHGGRVLCGGKTLEDVGPNFYAPTIIDNLNWSHDGPLRQLLHEEVFGPMIPVIPFKTEHEAVQIANDVDVGLAAYACTESHKRLWRLAQDLEFGMVGLNEGAISAASIPFGGVKDSGVNRDGGPSGIENYLDTHYILKGGVN